MTPRAKTEEAPEGADDDDGWLDRLIGRELLGRYRIDRLLGIGGTGAVFRGHQLTLKRDVAIKVLHPRLMQNDRVFKRFQREAESTARFEHPNIVQVLEAGATEDGFHFIVMQLLDGNELYQIMGEPFAPARAAELMRQVFCGLEHAHQRGVVHRDLKPENVFLTVDHEAQEAVKLVDFGLAKLVEQAGDAEALTRLGMVFGTPGYMSPEQATGQAVDHRTDLYSAGLIFYGLLAGRPPFLELDPVALMRAQVKQSPPPLPEDVPAPLAELVLELLAKRPEDRPADASHVRARLEDMLPELARASVRRGAGSSWRRVATVGALAAALAIAVAILFGREDRDASAPEAAETATASAPGPEIDAPAPAPAPPAAEAASTSPPPTSRGPDPAERPPPPTPDPSDAKKTSKKSSAKTKKKKKKKKGLFSGLRRDGD